MNHNTDMTLQLTTSEQLQAAWPPDPFQLAPRPHTEAVWLPHEGQWVYTIIVPITNKLLKNPTKQTINIPASATYAQAKGIISGKLRETNNTIFSNYKRRKPEHIPKLAYMKIACAELRKLKEMGIVFGTGSHPLQYFRHAPKGDPGDILEPYWSRDHVFRAASRNILRSSCTGMKSWEQLLQETLDLIRDVTSTIPKFLRRQLAQRKISWVTAVSVYDCYSVTDWDGFKRPSITITHDNINKLRNAPKWIFSSAEILRNYKNLSNSILSRPTLKDVRTLIKYNGRQVHGPMFPHEMKTLASNLHREMGLRIPKTIKGWIKLHKDYHKRDSTLNQVIQLRRRNNGISRKDVYFWKEMPSLPPLDIAIDGEIVTSMPECTVLWKYDDIRKEGILMNHCIGGYAGLPYFIAHLELKHGSSHFKASFMVTNNGFDQCYGPRNAINPLSDAARVQWIPLVREMIRDMTPNTQISEDIQEKNEEISLRMPRYDF